VREDGALCRAVVVRGIAQRSCEALARASRGVRAEAFSQLVEPEACLPTGSELCTGDRMRRLRIEAFSQSIASAASAIGLSAKSRGGGGDCCRRHSWFHRLWAARAQRTLLSMSQGFQPVHCVRRRSAAPRVRSCGGGIQGVACLQRPSVWGSPAVLPNPSLHPKCYSGLRPLPHSGELKR
jgi:hypothetical protein